MSKPNSTLNTIHNSRNAADRNIGKNICYVLDIFELRISNSCLLYIYQSVAAFSKFETLQKTGMARLSRIYVSGVSYLSIPKRNGRTYRKSPTNH